MQSQVNARWLRRMSGMILAVLLMLVAVGVGRADDPVRVSAGKNSTALVPADASFYAALLRCKEQIDLVYNSKAYKALRELPLVKTAYARLKSELGKEDGPMAQVNRLMQSKENQELVQLLIEMASDEVFVYGDKSWGDLLALAGKVSNAQNVSQVRALLNGSDVNKAGMRGMLLNLQSNRKMLRLPDLVFGFKLKNADRAEAQIKRLEEMATNLIELVPALKGKLSRTKVGSSNLLTLQLDGSLIPWEDVNLRDFEEKKDEFEALLDHARKMTLNVSLGVKDGYLLLALTSTVKNLETFGSGKALAGVEELAVLKKFADKPVTDLTYVSKTFLDKLSGLNTDYSELIGLAKEALDQAPIKEARKEAIKKDIDRLIAEAKKPDFVAGAQVAVSYMTPSGYEAYFYNFSKMPQAEAVDCKLLRHVGGDPILAAAFGFTSDGKGYAETIRLLKIAYGHLEAVLLDMAPEEGREMYNKVSKAIFPILQRFDDTTTKLLIPSLKQSGLGLVLDAKWKSKRWAEMAPELPREMPLPELGLLLGISDAAKFTQAMTAYRTILSDLYEKLREAVPNGDNLPGFRIPAPENEKSKSGTLYFYPLPDLLGLDKQVQPVLGVAKDVSVVALSRAHGERLMASTPLKNPGALAGNRKLIGGFILNWNALIDAVEPWLEFSLANAPIPQKAEFGDLGKQLKVLLAVFRTFKNVTCATYVDEGKIVTHTIVTISDLGK